MFSINCFAQDYSEEQMQQKTLQAIAKFYKLDIIGQETSRRLQEKFLPKNMQPFIPYILVLEGIFIENKIIYRETF